MIPKTIHYCWFGGKPLPASARKCIASWRKYFPDYEIREWNEENFDVGSIPYTRDAYAERKYAFVSDYARFWVLHRYGGIYFDTDVEVVRPMDDIVERGAFMGWGRANGEGRVWIEPGLVLGTEAGTAIYEEILARYATLSLYDADGSISDYTMIPLLTDLFASKGLRQDGTLQTVCGITAYPAAYFCPMDSLTGQIHRTPDTRCIHWYTMSWMPWHKRLRASLMRRVRGALAR